jgi:hypothetical protein
MRAVVVALVVLVGAVPQEGQPPPPRPRVRPAVAERESLRAAETRLRMVPPGSAAQETLRARRDSLRHAVMAAERAYVDSIRRARRAMADSLGRHSRPSSNPMDGPAPFFGYTWVFYADVAIGALIAWFFAWRRRRGQGGLSRLWTFVVLLAGGAFGAVMFFPLFLLNAIFSIGFSATPPWLMFLFTALAMLFVVASAAELGGRRQRPF